MQGNRGRRARVSHVCSRSRACSRQVSARAHVEEAATGTLRSVGIRVPSNCTRSRPAGRGAASGERVCAGGGVSPRASAASTAPGQRGPGHHAPCGIISRQVKHTRSPWVSSYASGAAAPVDRCTKRRPDTSDCSQPHPVGEAPSRRAHLGIGQNHMPDGCVEAGVRGRDRGLLGWDGRIASSSVEASSVSVGPAAGGGASRVSPRMPTCISSGRSPSAPPGGPEGQPVYSPACPRLPVPGRLPSPSTGGPEGQYPLGEVSTALGRPSWLAPPSGGRASAGRVGGPHRAGAGLGRGPGGGGAHGWPRRMEALYVSPALRIPGPAPQGQAICVAVGRHESRPRVLSPGCLLRVLPPGGGQGLMDLRPQAGIQQESPGPPLGGWHWSVPPLS